MNTYYVTPNENPELWKIAKAVGYKGKKLTAQPFKGPMSLNSYWSGGSKDNWSFYNLDSGQISTVSQNGTPFDGKDYGLSELPENVCLVNHCCFCGKYSCELYFPQSQITKLLGEAPDISEDESIIIDYTCALKSSYAGVKNYRFVKAKRATGITEERWNAAKQSCIEKKWLNKAGAITPKGRNMRQRPAGSVY
jgi:hypothetical protein